jgi:deazaflavin-dependent oxidoreductase (nitroreductase family)
MKVLVAIMGVLLLALATVLAIFTLGLRTKSPAVLGAIRRMNRTYVNPRQRDAGAPGASASVVRHTGRTSGATYETPVVAEPTGDGFVIALPYGRASDWLQNVLASGSATVVHDGELCDVVDPEVVPIAAGDAAFSPSERRAHRIFGTTECLTLRRAER